jgi:hypothetical protein
MPGQDIKKAERQKLLREKKYEAQVSGELNRIAEGEGGASAAYARLTEIESKPKKGYSNEEWQAFVNNQRIQIGRTDTLLQATKGVATEEFKAEVKNYESRAQLGFEIPESERTAMTAKVAGTPYEAGVSMANQMAEFAVQPQDKRNQLLADAQARSAAAKRSGKRCFWARY